MRLPKTYKTVSGELALTVRAKTNLFVSEYEEATAEAKALGYASLQAYLDQKLADIVYWRLKEEYDQHLKDEAIREEVRKQDEMLRATFEGLMGIKEDA